MSPSLAGGAKCRDFAVNHGIFLIICPIIKLLVLAIWKPYFFRIPKWIRTLFCMFANKINILLTDGLERPDIIWTNSHLQAHLAASIMPDFAVAEQAAAQYPAPVVVPVACGTTAPTHANLLWNRNLPQSAER